MAKIWAVEGLGEKNDYKPKQKKGKGKEKEENRKKEGEKMIGKGGGKGSQN